MGEIQTRNAGKNPNDLLNYTRSLMLIGQMRANGDITEEEERELKESFKSQYQVVSNYLVGRSPNSKRAIADMEVRNSYGRQREEGRGYSCQA